MLDRTVQSLGYELDLWASKELDEAIASIEAEYRLGLDAPRYPLPVTMHVARVSRWCEWVCDVYAWENLDDAP